MKKGDVVATVGADTFTIERPASNDYVCLDFTTHKYAFCDGVLFRVTDAGKSRVAGVTVNLKTGKDADPIYRDSCIDQVYVVRCTSRPLSAIRRTIYSDGTPGVGYAALSAAEAVGWNVAGGLTSTVRANVYKSDATMVLCYKFAPEINDVLLEVVGFNRPQIIVEMQKQHSAADLRKFSNFFRNHNTVYIAGNRDADEQAVEAWLTQLFRDVLDTDTATTRKVAG